MTEPDLPQELIHHFWAKRLKVPRACALLAASVNAINEVKLAFVGYDELSEFQVAYRVLQPLVLIPIFFLLVPSMFSEKYNWMVRFGFMLTALREILHVYNWEGLEVFPTRRLIDINMGLVISVFGLNFHLSNFNKEERGHLLFAMLYVNLIIFGVFLSVQPVADTLQDRMLILLTFPAIQVGAFLLLRGESLHSDAIRRIFAAMQDHKFIKMVLDTFSNPIAILSPDCRLTYSNPAFKRTFLKIVEAFEKTQLPRMDSTQRSLELERSTGRRATAWTSTKYYFKSQVRKMIRTLSRLRQPNDIVKSKAREENYLVDEENSVRMRFNDCSQFFESQIFKTYSNEEAPAIQSEAADKYSLRMLLEGDSEDIEKLTFSLNFSVINPHEPKPRESSDTPSKSSADSLFLRIKFENLTKYGHSRTLVQFIDVTDQVLYDISKEEKQLLSMINATISHELRNPLNSVVSQSEIKEVHHQRLETLIETYAKKDPKQHIIQAVDIKQILSDLKKADRIQTLAAQMMTFQVQNFLDYAQIKAKKFRVNPREFNIREAIARVMNLQMESAKANNIEFSVDMTNIVDDPFSENQVTQTFSSRVFTDEQRLMQVLLNLQSNALKFTRNGSVIIRASIDEKEDESSFVSTIDHQRYLTVEVVDTGLGVAYEDQEKLFKLFGFSQHINQFNRSGIGLGLVISEKIVKQLGGEIGFTSVPAPEEGHGSRFYFRIKISDDVRSRSGSMAPFSERSHLQEPASRGRNRTIPKEEYCLNSTKFVYDWRGPELKISGVRHTQTLRFSQIDMFHKQLGQVLIVDDQVFNINALQTILQLKFGIKPEQCLTAMDGKEALEVFKKNFEEGGAIKLILMDCNMPFMDGYESTQKLREFLSSEHGLSIYEQPVVSAVTGHVEPQHVAKCFEHGMNQVISKPVDLLALKAALSESHLV